MSTFDNNCILLHNTEEQINVWQEYEVIYPAVLGLTKICPQNIYSVLKVSIWHIFHWCLWKQTCFWKYAPKFHINETSPYTMHNYAVPAFRRLYIFTLSKKQFLLCFKFPEVKKVFETD